MVEYKPTCISLFAGCGGSSLGYHLAGYKELLAIDFDDNAVETFKLNFKDVPIWKADISQLSGTKIMDFCGLQVGELDLLDGSPPCQGFSTAGKRLVCDTRNDLMNHYIRLVKAIQPKVFVMENVSGMVKGKMKGLFIEYVRAMKEAGYQVSCRLLNAKWFSVPQSRQRMICIGVRNDLKMQPVFPNAHDRVITVRDAIKGIINKTFVHTSEYVSCEMLKVPQGKSAAFIRKDKMHFGNERLHFDKPSSIIRKSMRPGMNAFYHPIEHRNMTIEELKRLQSFPDDFKFIGKPVEQWARIGNSVPPLMTKAIAETIRDEIFGKL
jgi:DNA (cytosine-5)-methyltransferase 1